MLTQESTPDRPSTETADIVDRLVSKIERQAEENGRLKAEVEELRRRGVERGAGRENLSPSAWPIQPKIL